MGIMDSNVRATYNYKKLGFSQESNPKVLGDFLAFVDHVCCILVLGFDQGL